MESDDESIVLEKRDKVLQLVNTPELNVFNGDMGEIVGITLAKDSEDKVDELVLEFKLIRNSTNQTVAKITTDQNGTAVVKGLFCESW